MIEMLASLTAFAGLWLMVLCFWVFLLISVWGSNENRIGAQVFTFVVFTSILLFFSSTAFAWVSSNILYILVYFIFLHIPIGVFWALYEWKEFCIRQLKYADSLYKNPDGTFKTKSSAISKGHSESMKEDWEEMKPDFRKEIDRISSWIVFWWFHLTEFLISDFVEKVCRALINKLGTVLQRIVDNRWK